MIVAGSASPLLLASAAGGYNLTNSLRFRQSASAYLNRTPSSAGNRQTWTYSTWVKRGALTGAIQFLMCGGSNSSGQLSTQFQFDGSNRLYLYDTVSGSPSNNIELVTTAVYRDPSAWYHIVLVADTTQATSSNRIKLYVNGVQVTAFSTATYPSQNHNTAVNNNVLQNISNLNNLNVGLTLDGYVAETIMVDGQALTPSSFGEFSSKTGVWQPIEYAGTYGTNGFYLPFTNISTTTTLGNDFSGNGNNWTTNNISLTAGSTYDSMTDVPTLTSATAANFAVVSPIDIGSGSSTNSGNLNYSSSSSTGNIQQSQLRATFSVNTGKWYWEVTRASITSGDSLVGVVQETQSMSSSAFSSATLRAYVSNGNKDNGTSSAYGATWTNSDVIGVALDMDAGTITFYKNNTSQGTAFTGLTGGYMPYIINNSSNTTSTGNFNFGQRPFAYTPPTGFVALNTFNLPTPTIGATASTQANKYMDATAYSGTGSSQTVVNSGAMQPDFVWIKQRNSTEWHTLADSIRGTNKQLFSNSTNAEQTNSTFLTAFASNGFTVDTSSATNASGSTYIGWQWKGGGTGVTNTAGSITSTVSANTSAGFSVVTYTGNSTAGATIGHGLGVAPSMIITKTRSTSIGNWGVYHRSLGATQSLNLNNTGAAFTSSLWWNNTAPTSTVFSVGTGNDVNGASTYVAYCFAEVAGYSKFGSYTGNASTDGTFVYTGFRPKYVLVKNTTNAVEWEVYDSTRNPSNGVNLGLIPNQSDAEGTYSPPRFDFLSNGFKLRTAGGGVNGSGNTIIYAAFAEVPTKFALAR